MKTLFLKSTLSSKSNTSLLCPYSLIFSLIREIRAVVDVEYLTTKGVFKNKGLLK
jgi:hypothetical protein